MNNSGVVGFDGSADGSGQLNHQIVESESTDQKRREALQLTSRRAQKKRKRSNFALLKELKTELKFIEKGNKSMKETIESQAALIKKLKRRYKELKLRFARLKRGNEDQNGRVEEAENQLINIHLRDLMALVRRGSRYESNVKRHGTDNNNHI